ncbi:hypothetical protein B0H15DRAFT_377710 [Mycena belliarum]|uniref:Uncharacterized protein n=1 Tax=Mycena belliarum TaxID=1033014 RepID=A0AAD6TZZ1_9AGAR|nr:hypothetical protein B0H15DRAFT_377710 [Mycena belliae]
MFPKLPQACVRAITIPPTSHPRIEPDPAPRVMPTSPPPAPARPQTRTTAMNAAHLTPANSPPMGLGCHNVRSALRVRTRNVLRRLTLYLLTQPRNLASLPPLSVPHIVAPALPRSPPNDLSAAHAAPPATPRFGVHAWFLFVMWRPQVPRSARKSAEAQFARSSTSVHSPRRALCESAARTARIPVPVPGGAFRPLARVSAFSYGSVLALLPTCALPKRSTAPPCAARVEPPANLRVSVLARLRTKTWRRQCSCSAPRPASSAHAGTAPLHLRQARRPCPPPQPCPSHCGAAARPPVPPRAFLRVALKSRSTVAR